MPTIPMYHSKGNIPTEGMPRIPENIGTPVGRALERGGEQLSSIGFHQLEQQEELKFLSELADVQTEAMERLSGMHRETLNSAEFMAEPEKTAASFAERAKAMQQEYVGRIKNERAAMVFKKQFAQDALRSIDHVANAAVKQQQMAGAGRLEMAVARAGRSADAATSEEEFQRNVGLGMAFIKQMQLAGAKPAELVKRAEKWRSERVATRVNTELKANPQAVYEKLSGGGYPYLDQDDRNRLLSRAQLEVEHRTNRDRIERERLDKQAKIEQVNTIRTDLKTRFPNDYDMQLRLVDDPKIYPDLQEKEREALKSDIRQDISFSQARAQRVQNQVDETVQATFLKDMVGGNPWTDTVITGSRASSDQQKKMMEASRAYRKHQEENAGRVYETDKAVEADVIAGIYSGKIKDKTALLPYLANGLSPDDVNKYAGLIDQAAKDPEHASAMHRAEQAFTARFKDHEDYWPELGRFMIDLEDAAKKKNLRGRAIFDEAESQMKMIGKSWFSSGTPLFMMRREDEFVEAPVEGMDMNRRKTIIEILKANGKPVTDEYVDALDKRMREQGK